MNQGIPVGCRVATSPLVVDQPTAPAVHIRFPNILSVSVTTRLIRAEHVALLARVYYFHTARQAHDPCDFRFD
jgi:hypothetical protein